MAGAQVGAIRPDKNDVRAAHEQRARGPPAHVSALPRTCMVFAATLGTSFPMPPEGRGGQALIMNQQQRLHRCNNNNNLKVLQNGDKIEYVGKEKAQRWEGQSEGN